MVQISPPSFSCAWIAKSREDGQRFTRMQTYCTNNRNGDGKGVHNGSRAAPPQIAGKRRAKEKVGDAGKVQGEGTAVTEFMEITSLL